MGSLKFPRFGEERRAMFFSKSITFDQEELKEVASATHSPAELEFIERLKTGDAAAFDTLVNRYTSEIYAVLFRLTQDAEEARDLTQETFLRALKAVKNFRGDADLKTWLYRIAVNESRNRFRWWKRRRREKTVSLDHELKSGEQAIHETLPGNSENPETETLRRERQTALRNALMKLPENFREAIILRDIQGMSYEEVAAALETNIGTIKSRIARGREELRRMLEGF
jgi:RNA polymerase sigma-70 factor (ECF subfamily)